MCPEDADSARSRAGTGKFVYGKSSLGRNGALEIDPVELKFSNETYETTRLCGLFGALRDAAPDSWRRQILDASVRQAMMVAGLGFVPVPSTSGPALVQHLHATSLGRRRLSLKQSKRPMPWSSARPLTKDPTLGSSST
jgi:hypothetical protein